MPNTSHGNYYLPNRMSSMLVRLPSCFLASPRQSDPVLIFQGIQEPRDIPRVLFAYAQIRHGRQGIDAGWVEQPANHVARCVGQNTRDILPVGDPAERRADVVCGADNPRYGVTACAKVLLQRDFSGGDIADPPSALGDRKSTRLNSRP